MEAISENIKLILPSLDDDILAKIMKSLEESGVQAPADLVFVEEKDLHDVLRPIQIRKLIASWGRKSHTGIGKFLENAML